MKRYKDKIVALSIFLFAFMFLGFAIFNISNFIKNRKENPIYDVMDYRYANTKDQFSLVLEDMSLPNEDEFIINKYLLDYFSMVNNKEFKSAYKLLNDEYVKVFKYSYEEFKAVFDRQGYIDFFITDYRKHEDRYIVWTKLFIGETFESIIENPKYVEMIFTIFLKDAGISIADEGIYSMNPSEIYREYENYNVYIDYIIQTTKGMIVQLRVFNKSESVVAITGIHGLRKGNRIEHEISNSNFLDYTLNAKGERINNILFKGVFSLDEIIIELDTLEELKIH